MTARLSRASTMRATLAMTLSRDGESHSLECVLLRESGNRLNVETRFVSIPEAPPCIWISDGVKMINGAEEGEEKTPGNLDLFILRGLAWGGSLTFMSGLSSLDEATLDRNLKGVSVSQFRMGGRETIEGREAVSVIYVIREERQPGVDSAAVVLWIDAQTRLPLKRKITFPGTPDLTLVETFRELRLNEPIDPARFNLAR